MRFKAVIFDVGGPILAEEEDMRQVDIVLKALLKDAGYGVSDQRFEEARKYAIDCYSPSYNSAAIWTIVKPDRQAFFKVRRSLTLELTRMRISPTLQPGVVDVLSTLAATYKIGLAGNQPASVRPFLKKCGIIDVCDFVGLSADMSVFKPDTRFFLAVLHAMGVNAHETVMVGDRLDNDIYPANILHMTTVRILTGPYRSQVPRTLRDEPHATIEDIRELPQILQHLESQDPSARRIL